MPNRFGRAESEQEEIARECVSILEETGRDRGLISYSELAQRISRNLSLSPPIDHHLELPHVLYDAVHLSLESWEDPSTAPLLSALAVYKDVPKPGQGHITLAKELGRKTGASPEAEERFWWREVESLWDHYSK